MKKIKYRIVYNRKKRLDSQGKALVQVEAYLLGKKAYFSTHIYIKPDQWNSRKSIICNHPHAEELNYMLEEFILNLQMREINAWKQGKEICFPIRNDAYVTEKIYKLFFIAANGSYSFGSESRT